MDISARDDPARTPPPPLRIEGRPPGFAAELAPWYAFLGGGVAWALQFVALYALTEIGCRSERLDAALWGVPALAWFGFAMTVWAALAAIGAAHVAYARFADDARADPVDDTGAPEVLGRRRFMAYAGLLMNGLFLLAILAHGLPFLVLNACSGS
jgi:hypothetical protein